MGETATWLRTACLAIAALASGAAGAPAHPFPFDTAAMPGFSVVTAEDGAMQARDMVVIEYRGPIATPMAAHLRTIWTAIAADPRFSRVVLRLDSPGGTQSAGEDVIAVLSEIRARVMLVTLVGDGDLCASMCIPVFIQGERRHASPASAWMFHGATRGLSNIPSVSLTARYLGYFDQRQVGVAFLQHLSGAGYLARPGEYWIDGTALAAESDIVTTVDPRFKARRPDSGPAAGILPGV